MGSPLNLDRDWSLPAGRQTAGVPDRVTIADVSIACGVTKGTISRILNRKTDFSCSSEVRAKVERIAGELGYRPDSLARALTTKRTQVVAILGLWPWTLEAVTIYHPLVKAAVMAVQAGGYHASANFPHPQHGNYPLAPFRADGALILQPVFLKDLDEIENGGIPYIAMDGVCGRNGTQVLLDDESGGRAAAAHLRARGRRTLAWFSQTDFGHHSTPDRLAGVRAVAPACWTGDTRDPAAWLAGARAAGVDGVVCYCAGEAVTLRRAALAAGLSLPGDLGLIAFNDDSCARDHSLSVLAVPARELGEISADLLLRRMARKTVPKLTVLNERLIERGSA